MQAQPSLFASGRLRRPEAMTRAAGGNLLALSLATAVSVAAQAADEIKSGKWEFTTQMQLPGAVQSAPSGQAAGGNAPMTRIACIDAANPIPAETQCKVDQVDRRGSLVTWAMTCNSPRGEIHSAGSARYAGNTMEGTVTARVPGPNGQPVDAPCSIAGPWPRNRCFADSALEGTGLGSSVPRDATTLSSRLWSVPANLKVGA